MVVLAVMPVYSFSQTLSDIGIENNSVLKCNRIILSDSSSVMLGQNKPLFSFMENTRLYYSDDFAALRTNDHFSATFEKNLNVTYKISGNYATGVISELVFENKVYDTMNGNKSNGFYYIGQKK